MKKIVPLILLCFSPAWGQTWKTASLPSGVTAKFVSSRGGLTAITSTNTGNNVYFLQYGVWTLQPQLGHVYKLVVGKSSSIDVPDLWALTTQGNCYSNFGGTRWSVAHWGSTGPNGPGWNLIPNSANPQCLAQLSVAADGTLAGLPVSPGDTYGGPIYFSTTGGQGWAVMGPPSDYNGWVSVTPISSNLFYAVKASIWGSGIYKHVNPGDSTTTTQVAGTADQISGTGTGISILYQGNLSYWNGSSWAAAPTLNGQGKDLSGGGGNDTWVIDQLMDLVKFPAY